MTVSNPPVDELTVFENVELPLRPILADEPTGNLDFVHGEEVLNCPEI